MLLLALEPLVAPHPLEAAQLYREVAVLQAGATKSTVSTTLTRRFQRKP